ncbi:MAG TPA: hypothetical protein DCP92_04585 [Nitrospiraceae bacterium]|jgi:hypothetical protein|nr:hypothetical protein [Nitrospiraceae bacterium]
MVGSKKCKLKDLLILLFILMVSAMMPISANGQTGQLSATPNSPISPPLVREGTLAVKLAGDLKLGTTENEAEAEDLLSVAGISPRNGWIADYPVTPDIVGELQAAIGEAADSGKLSIEKNAALQIFQDDISNYSLPLTPDTSGNVAGAMTAPSYPDIDNYYSDEGPPTVTYYAPPPDYAYLYTWVPYPFWWTDFWFPGFFVLSDFSNVRVHWHHDGHEYEGFVSNHFRNPKTGGISRVDPATRLRGGTSPGGGYKGWTSPRAPAPARAYRGYGLTAQPEEVRTSVFDHSVNRQVEYPASQRGFQSRSSAGQLPAGGGAGTPHGGGGSGGGFHGGGRR